MTASLKKLLEDERIPAVAAIVRAPADGSDYWSLVGPSDARQLLIHVVTKGHRTPIWCHAQGGGRRGRGCWSIPDVGTEVLVSFDNGQFEGDAFIVGEFGRLSDSIDASTTLILDSTVEIKSVGGTAVKLPTIADMDALKNAISNAIVVAMDGGASFKTSLLAALVNWPTGTTVLRAE